MNTIVANAPGPGKPASTEYDALHKIRMRHLTKPVWRRATTEKQGYGDQNGRCKYHLAAAASHDLFTIIRTFSPDPVTMSIQPLLHKPAFMYPWEKRTLFLGRLPGPVTAAYGAATLVISLGDPVDLKVGGRIIRSGSFLVPGGVRVSINAGLQPVAIFHLDVLGDDYKRFQGCFRHQGRSMTVSHDVRDGADFHALLNQLYRQPEASAMAYTQLDGLLEYSFGRAGNPSRIDPLVQEAVDHIKQNYQDNIPVEELAQRVNVSTPTLIRKFKQQSGVPIRRFRLWHRIYESMIFISAGQNLTDAALSAGFSDSSHYTHTLQAMWGVSPSNLFARDIRAEIVPPQP